MRPKSKRSHAQPALPHRYNVEPDRNSFTHEDDLGGLKIEYATAGVFVRGKRHVGFFDRPNSFVIFDLSAPVRDLIEGALQVGRELPRRRGWKPIKRK
jgi:hypothetical protein